MSQHKQLAVGIPPFTTRGQSLWESLFSLIFRYHLVVYYSATAQPSKSKINCDWHNVTICGYSSMELCPMSYVIILSVTCSNRANVFASMNQHFIVFREPITSSGALGSTATVCNEFFWTKCKSSKDPLVKTPVVQPLKKFLTFYETRRSIIVFIRTLHWSLSSARALWPTPPHHLYKTHRNIINPPTPCPRQ